MFAARMPTSPFPLAARKSERSVAFFFLLFLFINLLRKLIAGPSVHANPIHTHSVFRILNHSFAWILFLATWQVNVAFRISKDYIYIDMSTLLKKSALSSWYFFHAFVTIFPYTFFYRSSLSCFSL